MGATRPLNQILVELRRALEETTGLEDAEREALRAAARDIRAVLSGTALGEEDSDGSLSEQLKEALERFEGSHPKLTQAVGRVADALSDLGI